MGVYKLPNARTHLPSYNEGSRLRSPRDEDAIGRQHIKGGVVSKETLWLAEAVRQLQWEINRMRKRGGTMVGPGGSEYAEAVFKFKWMEDECLFCTHWDGTTEEPFTVSGATVSDGGFASYSTGQTLTLVGGTFTTAATFNITAVTGGGATGMISAVELLDGGQYTDAPTNPCAVTGGTGSAATLDVTFDGYRIAKPFKLRKSAPDVTIDTAEITYSDWDWVNQKRVATILEVPKYEVITPRYCHNDLIWANRPGLTLVTIDGAELQWMDLNKDGRKWDYKIGQD